MVTSICAVLNRGTTILPYNLDGGRCVLVSKDFLHDILLWAGLERLAVAAKEDRRSVSTALRGEY